MDGCRICTGIGEGLEDHLENDYDNRIDLESATT